MCLISACEAKTNIFARRSGASCLIHTLETAMPAAFGTKMDTLRRKAGSGGGISSRFNSFATCEVLPFLLGRFWSVILGLLIARLSASHICPKARPLHTPLHILLGTGASLRYRRLTPLCPHWTTLSRGILIDCYNTIMYFVDLCGDAVAHTEPYLPASNRTR